MIFCRLAWTVTVRLSSESLPSVLSTVTNPRTAKASAQSLMETESKLDILGYFFVLPSFTSTQNHLVKCLFLLQSYIINILDDTFRI